MEFQYILNINLLGRNRLVYHNIVNTLYSLIVNFLYMVIAHYYLYLPFPRCRIIDQDQLLCLESFS